MWARSPFPSHPLLPPAPKAPQGPGLPAGVGSCPPVGSDGEVAAETLLPALPGVAAGGWERSHRIPSPWEGGEFGRCLPGPHPCTRISLPPGQSRCSQAASTRRVLLGAGGEGAWDISAPAAGPGRCGLSRGTAGAGGDPGSWSRLRTRCGSPGGPAASSPAGLSSTAPFSPEHVRADVSFKA